ncbi:hypothetical protein AB0K47_07050 [Streptomyces tirandamycinicus]|uniref:Uncharacterized protein n=1 Tax=Streptomyces tirandamycinicus TaxID=2174846 RepID=A0A2S1SRD8_9ACTN|nr:MULTISPECIES: hypothetical protein [Streptomyces]AWI28955.1 hypothetical protein DDW44_09300 [Streptomyces tirandamycinicus]MCY0985200.1 hypothetical protein [Streptomyces tirandamycinicus]NNJ04091.1 hypothetical protein [Streptomyces sp. PKU-MA01144]TFE58595.1 hypothetical protein E3E14_00235 [Streptomyces sp. ICN441]
MNNDQLNAEAAAELLPGREALGRLRFNFVRTSNVSERIAYVDAHNESLAANVDSPDAIAVSEANQTITISQ